MTFSARGAWQVSAVASVAAVPVTALLAVRNGNAVWSSAALPLGSLLGATYGAVAVLLIRKAPGNVLARVLCVVALGFSWSELAAAYAERGLMAAPGSLPGAGVASWLATWLWAPALVVLLTWLPLLVPDGGLPPGRWRWLAWGCAVPLVLWAAVAVLVWPYRGTRLMVEPPLVENALIDVIGGGALVSLLAVVPLCLLSLVRRYRQTDAIRRAQLRLVVVAAAVTVAVFASANAAAASPAVQVVAVPLLPVALLVAVLRYRLFDIDLVVSRALVYVVLTAGVVALYMVVVGVASAAFDVTGLGPSLLATALVAVLFQPAHQRLWRMVGRMVYGDRDPLDAISRLGPQLQAGGRASDVLPALCRTVAQALRVPAVTIQLPEPDSASRDTCSSPAAADALAVPLLQAGVQIGTLAITPRAGQRRFSAADRRLIDSLAPVVSAAALSVRLTGDLARSRERLVAAREEERRRLRRDLHDGLGSALAGITLEIQAAANLLDVDAAATREVLAAAEERARSAVDEVRRVVYALRPPVLDQFGLVRAIEEHAATVTGASGPGSGLVVVVHASGLLDGLPAAVEVAAYMIALEALTNVVRHAASDECRIDLFGDDAVHVVVRDNGTGSADQVIAGIGVTSMRERAEELGGSFAVEDAGGGGLRVVACLPKAMASG